MLDRGTTGPGTPNNYQCLCNYPEVREIEPCGAFSTQVSKERSAKATQRKPAPGTRLEEGAFQGGVVDMNFATLGMVAKAFVSCSALLTNEQNQKNTQKTIKTCQTTVKRNITFYLCFSTLPHFVRCRLDFQEEVQNRATFSPKAQPAMPQDLVLGYLCAELRTLVGQHESISPSRPRVGSMDPSRRPKNPKAA